MEHYNSTALCFNAYFQVNLAASAGRYVMYKIGPILTLNHGMGMPSLSIALHEIVKLLFYAGASGKPQFKPGNWQPLGTTLI